MSTWRRRGFRTGAAGFPRCARAEQAPSQRCAVLIIQDSRCPQCRLPRRETEDERGRDPGLKETTPRIAGGALPGSGEMGSPVCRMRIEGRTSLLSVSHAAIELALRDCGPRWLLGPILETDDGNPQRCGAGCRQDLPGVHPRVEDCQRTAPAKGFPRKERGPRGGPRLGC